MVISRPEGEGLFGSVRLPLRAARLRGAATKLVVTDVDGVLTDGGVYYSERGEALKRFSLRDGMGVERLRNDGIETAFMTRESSPIVARRAEKLGLRLVYLGVYDKKEMLPRLLADGDHGAGLDVSQLAYIGDDVNDLEIMEAIGARGLVGAPADAMPQVSRVAHLACARAGGAGAFRDFAEWILELRAEAREPEAREPEALDSNDGGA
jgi:3-deoxy-D-manno-octulosonate 8-phosphate phosphatase (KDO 8-P phosphatase)